ncbi:anthranilate synthase component 1 [Pleionea sp. CnH1-48]|uniref:anthranilate synthase component 1 n=1 Tax=Pleionea sp. CnH1-48 TaxID=2954494 RepID=UPI002097F23E|nr:anthranilate synthase component 1 [Pleionea sp. CnH1-48]MCO7223102.1 anthranilate synthase component 1 [Pleionea sp. CnH1-48]
MSNSNKVQTLSRRVSMPFEVSRAFETLTKEQDTPCALLETASISTKEHTKSVMMLSAALQVRCTFEQVLVTALNANGEQLLGNLQSLFDESELSQHQLHIRISHQSLHQEVDEFKKLHSASVFDVLRNIMSLVQSQSIDDYSTLLIGTFSFDCYELFESLPSLPADSNDFPHYDFFLADQLLMVDHRNHNNRLVSKVFSGASQLAVLNDYQQKIAHHATLLESMEALPSTMKKNASLPTPEQPKLSLDDASYCELVKKVKQHVYQGDVFQTVVARDFKLPCSKPYNAYQELKQSNPSPYMFYVQTPDYVLFGASPESAVKVDADTSTLSIYPIAGTRRRGQKDNGEIDADLDARIELELKSDEKEKAEHSMLVDLARNDVARVCVPGSRKLDRLMEVDRYSHVMHLVSKVSGQLDKQYDALSAYQACMNMGTLTGAPKVKASQLLRQYEGKRRGVYGGAMGYLNAAGDMDTAIVIRSALVQNQQATVSAGAGIVFDSDPMAEAQETSSKAAAVIAAIQSAAVKEAS